MLRRRALRTTSKPSLSQREQVDVFPSQSQDPSSATILSSLQTSRPVPQTMSEKIIQRYALDLAKDQYVKAGDFISLRPHKCMTHGRRTVSEPWATTGRLTDVDNSWPMVLKFKKMGAKKIHDPKQIVMTLGRDVQDKSNSHRNRNAQIEAFAKAQGVDF